MKNEQIDENNNSLNIVKLMLDEKISKHQLIQKLKIKESTFYKHINLIREIGFNLIKDEDVYELLHFKEGINFLSYELSIFTYLLLMSHVMLPKEKSTLFLKSVQKMLHLSSKEEYEKVQNKYEFYKQQTVSDYYKDKIVLLRQYINEKTGIVITTKDKKTHKIKPVDFAFGKKEKMYLNYIDVGYEIKSICLDNIVKIAKNDLKIEIDGKDEIIFELYGRLAKSYLLKDEERVIDSTKDKLVIANSSYDRDILFRRLLRYDILCKVVFPKVEVEKFNTLIRKTLSNIDGITDNLK